MLLLIISLVKQLCVHTGSYHESKTARKASVKKSLTDVPQIASFVETNKFESYGEKYHDKMEFKISNLNCKQWPLNTSGTLNREIGGIRPIRIKFAYAWYATDSEYLCSALVAMLHLKSVRKGNLLLNYTVDYVLVLYFVENTEGQDFDELVNLWEKEGAFYFF